MKLETTNGRCVFTGSDVPMELARKTWPDRYAAVRAAEAAGYVCYANGNVVEDDGQCHDPDAEVNQCSGDHVDHDYPVA